MMSLSIFDWTKYNKLPIWFPTLPYQYRDRYIPSLSFLDIAQLHTSGAANLVMWSHSLLLTKQINCNIICQSKLLTRQSIVSYSYDFSSCHHQYKDRYSLSVHLRHSTNEYCWTLNLVTDVILNFWLDKLWHDVILNFWL